MSFRLANLDSRAVLVDATGYAYDLETISDGRLGPDLMAAIADIDALHDLDATLGDRDPVPFTMPLAVPAVGHVGLYVKDGRNVLEDLVVEILP